MAWPWRSVIVGRSLRTAGRVACHCPKRSIVQLSFHVRSPLWFYGGEPLLIDLQNLRINRPEQRSPVSAYSAELTAIIVLNLCQEIFPARSERLQSNVEQTSHGHCFFDQLEQVFAVSLFIATLVMGIPSDL